MADTKTTYATAPTEKKKRKPQGPRKPTELAVVVKVTDAAGNVIPDAQVQIVTATKDISSAFRSFKENPGSDMTTFTLSNEKKEANVEKAA